MKGSKLKELVENLNKKEISSFKKFLKSPFFNHRADVIKLFDWMIRQQKRTKPVWTKEAVFATIFPGIAYSERDINLLMSYLFRLLEQFLSIQVLMNDKVNMKYHLMQNYKQRNLPKHLQYTLNGLQNALEEQSLKDGPYYEKYRDLYWTTYQNEVSQKPSGNLHLEKLSELTDIAYYTQKIRQICLVTAHQAVYFVEYKTAHQLSQSFFPQLEEKNLIQIPAIGIYYHGYFLLRDDDDQNHFKTFKQLLFEKGKQVGLQEIRELYLIAINYCIKQVNKGNKSFFGEMLSLYQKGLEAKVLIEHGKISRFTYHNVVAAAIQTQEFDWAKGFINDYRKYLDEPYIKDSYFFNMARLEYALHNYDAAQAYINKAHFQDVLLHLGAKAITLKIYYTLQEIDLLEAHLNAMDNFIRRNRVIGYHKKNYLNIIRYTKKLIGINFYDKEALQNLSEKIEKEEILTEKDWLLTQLNNH